jgi:uncharacterized protein YukJ
MSRHRQRHAHGTAPHPQDPTVIQHSHRPRNNNRRNQGHFPKAKRAGDKVNYHVLRCRPVITHNSPQVQHDHLQVLLEIDSGTRYWSTINIRSGDDQVFYAIDEDYNNPITRKLHEAGLPQGFTKLESAPGGLALDYIREHLVDLGTMDGLRAAGDPEDEGISDMLTTKMINISRAPDAQLFIFGSRFDDGAHFSSFDLPTGIHDIHMNQGSVGSHAKSNGIFQDGALLSFYPSEDRWTAVFLKFASQAERTDGSGNAE